MKSPSVLKVWLWLVMVMTLAGCVELPPPAQPADILALRSTLTSLGPAVKDDEAGQVADCAYDYSRELATRYRVVRPALLHNLLVDLGLKKRGLCYQWAEDLLEKLQTYDLQTLELHWGMARPGTLREHNCIVVTARGQPFGDGIILDPWRHGGMLLWLPVAHDNYPWIEGELTPTAAATGR